MELLLTITVSEMDVAEGIVTCNIKNRNVQLSHLPEKRYERRSIRRSIQEKLMFRPYVDCYKKVKNEILHDFFFEYKSKRCIINIEFGINAQSCENMMEALFEYLPTVILSIFQITFILPIYTISTIDCSAEFCEIKKVDNVCRTLVKPNKAVQLLQQIIEEPELYIPSCNQIAYTNYQYERPPFLSETILVDLSRENRNLLLRRHLFFHFIYDRIRGRRQECSDYLKCNRHNDMGFFSSDCVRCINWAENQNRNTSIREFTSSLDNTKVLQMERVCGKGYSFGTTWTLPVPLFRHHSSNGFVRKISIYLRNAPMTFNQGKTLNYLPRIENVYQSDHSPVYKNAVFKQTPTIIHSGLMCLMASFAASLPRPSPQITISQYIHPTLTKRKEVACSKRFVAESAESSKKKLRVMTDVDFFGLDFTTFETSANSFFQTRDDSRSEGIYGSADDIYLALQASTSSAHGNVSNNFPPNLVGRVHTILVSGDLFDSSFPLFQFVANCSQFGVKAVDVKLSRPIDIIVDSLSCICVLLLDDLADRGKNETFLRQLATQCQKFQNIGILIIGPSELGRSSDWTESLTAFSARVSMFPCRVIIRQASSISKATSLLFTFIAKLREHGAAQGVAMLEYSAKSEMKYQFLDSFPTINLSLAFELLRRNSLRDLIRLESGITCLFEGFSQFSRDKIKIFLELVKLHIGLIYTP